MSTGTQHTMMRTGSTKSGAEEWRCPHCGRRLVLQWRPFQRVVLDPGDERVQHIGAKGGVDAGTVDVRPSSRVTLPEDQARWLAENGMSWDGDDAPPDR
jgi:DNA-directed RNA polymerase subunit RPC12/RpoP